LLEQIQKAIRQRITMEINPVKFRINFIHSEWQIVVPTLFSNKILKKREFKTQIEFLFSLK